MINILTYLTDSLTRTKPCAHFIILDFKIKYIIAHNLRAMEPYHAEMSEIMGGLQFEFWKPL